MKQLFVLLCCVWEAHAQTGGVPELFKKVSERYRHMTTYVIEIQRKNSDHSVTAGGSDPSPVVNAIVLARSGAMLHYEGTALLVKSKWISDGKQTWFYNLAANEYTVEPASPWKDAPDAGIQRLDWEYVSKFQALAGLASRATLVKADLPPDGLCPGTTALVKMELGTTKTPATELLRIDQESGLICHSTADWTRSLGGALSAYHTTIKWDYKQLSGPVDPSLFIFAPSKSPKLVKKLKNPVGPIQ